MSGSQHRGPGFGLSPPICCACQAHHHFADELICEAPGGAYSRRNRGAPFVRAESPCAESVVDGVNRALTIVCSHPEWHDELARRVRSVKDGTAILHDRQDVERELDEIIKR